MARAPYKMLVIRINGIVIVMVIVSMEHVYMNICVPHVWHKSVLCEFYYTKINFIMLSKYENVSNKNGAGHFDGVFEKRHEILMKLHPRWVHVLYAFENVVKALNSNWLTIVLNDFIQNIFAIWYGAHLTNAKPFI